MPKAGTASPIAGEDKREWLRTFLTLPLGIPSHDTFNRAFAALDPDAMDPDELERGFAARVSSMAQLTAGEVAAIDGKTLRGTREAGKKALAHMVSAWAAGRAERETRYYITRSLTA